MNCEDCKNTRAKGPARRIRMTVVASEHPFEDSVGESVERTVCASCYRFRIGLSYLKIEVLEPVKV